MNEAAEAIVTMKITDFTSVLPKPDNVYAFNPSIAHYRDGLYLCVFRGFVRYKQIHQKGANHDYTGNPFTDPNHPWLGGLDATQLWWKHTFGDDSTRFAMLRIKDGKTELAKDYSGGGLKSASGTALPNTMEGNDARLLQLSGDLFLMSYNVWVTDDGIIIKNGRTCGDWCGLIGTRTVTVGDGGHTLTLGDEKILCPGMSNQVEKNWSFWMKGKAIYFSYGLFPGHDIVRVYLKDGVVDCGEKVVNSVSTFFKTFRDYYNDGVAISVTTPAIRIRGGFLGVGHIKFAHKDLDDKFPRGSPLYEFAHRMWDSKKTFHPQFVYMMFLYMFDADNGNLKSISPMFLPPSKTALCFPSGLSLTSNMASIIVSYGNGDTSCDFFILTGEALLKSLVPVKDLNPESVLFGMVGN